MVHLFQNNSFEVITDNNRIPVHDYHIYLMSLPRIFYREKKSFPQHHIGYSDHTLGMVAPIAAVALGAEAVEKHYTISHTLPGTDHILSLSPDQFRDMITQIRRLEDMRGLPEKAPRPSEMKIRDMVRSRGQKDRG